MTAENSDLDPEFLKANQDALTYFNMLLERTPHIPGVLLKGPYGSGKSALSRHLFASAMEKKINPLWITGAEFEYITAKARRKGKNTPMSSNLAGHGLWILDDLSDIGPRASLVQEELRHLLDLCFDSKILLWFTTRDSLENLSFKPGLISRLKLLLPVQLKANHHSGRKDGKLYNPEAILEAVCTVFHVNRENLLSKKRVAELVFPRHLAMYMMDRHTELNKSAIARLFCRSDHSVTIHAIKKIELEMQKDGKIDEALRELERILAEKRG